MIKYKDLAKKFEAGEIRFNVIESYVNVDIQNFTFGLLYGFSRETDEKDSQEHMGWLKNEVYYYARSKRDSQYWGCPDEGVIDTDRNENEIQYLDYAQGAILSTAYIVYHMESPIEIRKSALRGLLAIQNSAEAASVENLLDMGNAFEALHSKFKVEVVNGKLKTIPIKNHESESTCRFLVLSEDELNQWF